MSISASLRDQVRRRAQFRCEFCNISEVDVGGLLTIDHFHPKSKGGNDEFDNLIYACAACNQFKQDYWPQADLSPKLWNPRLGTVNQHFIERDDGSLLSLTPEGEFTLKRLRLNRAQLVAARLRRYQQAEAMRLLQRYQEMTMLLSQSNIQLSELAIEQQGLLKEQRELLRILLRQLGRE
jgi:CRISPR/Cas system Type II protein with McrA/HNH and RuvC-like nuclease domain